jgi:hypothetical protein
MPKDATPKSKPAAKTPVAAKRPAPATKTSPKPETDNAGPKEKSKEKPKDKAKRPKMVRDSFTMPESEYKVLGEVKRACLKAGIEIKKSELLRIGVELIRQTEVDKLKSVLATLAPLKAGRPKKEK